MFAVEDPEAWHANNLVRNHQHYSTLRFLGPGAIARVQGWAARVYYNTLIPTTLPSSGSAGPRPMTIKYGVISCTDLHSELENWDSFYLAGRLQKPVAVLKHSTEMRAAIYANRMSALKCALAMHSDSIPRERDGAMLPRYLLRVKQHELFMKIAVLSYIGDPRMGIAENKNKVANIVSANLAHFKRVYAPLLEELGVQEKSDGDYYAWEWDAAKLEEIMRDLPEAVWHNSLVDGQAGDLFPSLVKSNTADRVLHDGIRNIVKRSATAQTIKGLLTAGVWKSVCYVGAKLKKACR